MTDGTRLESFRLTDSFLPVGACATSYGLGQFIQEELISDADDLQALLSTYLKWRAGPCELVTPRTAHTATRDGDFDAVCRTDRRLTAATLSKRFRKSARQSDNRLLSLQWELRESPLFDEYAETVDVGDATGNYAAVLGVAAASANIGASETCLLCYHDLVTGLVGAAQRMLSLRHTGAQQILRDPQPAMIEVATDSANRGVGEISPFAPLIDVLSANHERANRRLFMS